LGLRERDRVVWLVHSRARRLVMCMHTPCGHQIVTWLPIYIGCTN